MILVEQTWKLIYALHLTHNRVYTPWGEEWNEFALLYIALFVLRFNLNCIKIILSHYLLCFKLLYWRIVSISWKAQVVRAVILWVLTNACIHGTHAVTKIQTISLHVLLQSIPPPFPLTRGNHCSGSILCRLVSSIPELHIDVITWRVLLWTWLLLFSIMCVRLIHAVVDSSYVVHSVWCSIIWIHHSLWYLSLLMDI